MGASSSALGKEGGKEGSYTCLRYRMYEGFMRTAVEAHCSSALETVLFTAGRRYHGPSIRGPAHCRISYLYLLPLGKNFQAI